MAIIAVRWIAALAAAFLAGKLMSKIMTTGSAGSLFMPL